MIRQSISQRMLQKLSPQQIQLMKLLQLPTAVIDQRIKEELEVNPALEEGDEDYEDEFAQQDRDDYNDEYEGDSEEPELQDSYDEFEYLSTYMDTQDGPAYNYDDANYKLVHLAYPYKWKDTQDGPAYNYDDANYNADEEQKTLPIPLRCN